MRVEDELGENTPGEAPPPFGGQELLVDASAWHRSRHPAVAADWQRAVLRGQIVICAPFMIEALFVARNDAEYTSLDAALREGFRHVIAGAETWAIALRAQRELAGVAPSFHRRRPIDLLLAAVAHEQSLPLLHYDADYDVIAEHTELAFESVWVAPRGSL